MFADWTNRGLNLWTVERASQTLATGITEYPLASISMTVGSSSSLSIAETITGGTSGATANILTKPTSTSITISIPSGTFSNGETITGGTSSASTTVGATVSLENAKAVGDLLDVAVRRSGTDFTMSRISRSEFLNIPTKTTEGRPTQYFFNRQVTPSITLWPTPENSTDSLEYFYVNRIQDMDSLTNTGDAPFRFLPCMVAGLAYYIAMKKAPDRIQILKAVYEEEFQRAADEDEDRVSLKLQPSIEYLRV